MICYMQSQIPWYQGLLFILNESVKKDIGPVWVMHSSTFLIIQSHLRGVIYLMDLWEKVKCLIVVATHGYYKH